MLWQYIVNRMLVDINKCEINVILSEYHVVSIRIWIWISSITVLSIICWNSLLMPRMTLVVKSCSVLLKFFSSIFILYSALIWCFYDSVFFMTLLLRRNIHMYIIQPVAASMIILLQLHHPSTRSGINWKRFCSGYLSIVSTLVDLAIVVITL